MGKIISALPMLAFAVVLLGCSSDISKPEIISPDEGKYSVIITAHDIDEEWEEVIKHYMDAEVIQTVTFGGLDTPPVKQVINDYDIEIGKEITALVFGHKDFVFQTTEYQELEDLFENQN